MKNKSLIGLTAALCILLQAASGAAWTFPWQQQATPSQDNRFNALYNQVSSLNTISNINSFSPYMQQAGYKSVKIYVSDLNKEFFVLSGQGTTLTRPAQVDKTFSLSTQQVKKAASMLKDGSLSYYEQWELYLMLRWA